MARKKAQHTNNRRRAPAPISTKSAINTAHGHQPSSARHDHQPTTTTEAPATTLVANRNHESHTTHVVPSTAAKNEGGAREDLADTKRMSTPELVDVIPAHHHVDHLSLTARSQAAHKEMDLLATSAQLILGEEELRYLGHHPTHSTTAYPSSSSNTTHNIDGSGGSTSHGSVRGGVANTHSVISIHPMHPLEEVLSRSIASAGKFGGGSASVSPSAQSKRSSILSASLSSSSIADVVEEDVEHIHHHQDGSRSRRAVGAPPITHAGVNGGTTPQNIVNVPAQRSSLKLEDAQHSRRDGDEHEPSSSPPTPSLLRLPPLHRRGGGAPSRSSSISSVVPPTHKDDVGVRPPAAHNNGSSSLLIKHESTPRKHTSSRRSSSSNQSLLSHSAHKTSNLSRASPSSQLPLILPSTRNTSLRTPRPPPSSSPVLPTLTEASFSRVPPSPSRDGQLHPLASSSALHLPSLGRQAGTSSFSTGPPNDAANTNTSSSSRTHNQQSPQFNVESSASEEHYSPPRYTDTADTNNRSIASSASFGNDDAHAAPPKPSTDVPPPLLPTESSSTVVVHDNSSATSSRNMLHQNTSNRRVCFSTEPDALTATSHKIGSSSAPGADSSSSTRISSPSNITQDRRQHRHDHRKRCSATDDDIHHKHVDGTHGARLSRPTLRGDDVSASPTVGVDERRNVLQHLVDVCDTPPHPTKPTSLSTTSHPPSAAEEIGPPSCVPHNQQHSARIHNHVGGVVRRPSADRRSPPILSSSPPLTHSNTQRTREENKSDFFSMSDVVGATPQTSTSPVSEHHISKFYVAFSARGADDDDDDDDDDDASRVSSAPPIHSAHSASGGAPHDVYDVGVVKTHPLQSSSSMLIINTPVKRDDEGRSSRMQHTKDDVSMSCSVVSSTRTEMEPPSAEVTACRNDRRTASSSPPPLLDDECTSHHLPSSREGAPWRFIIAFSARGDDDDGRLPCSGTNTTEGSIISVAPPIRNAASLDDIQRNIISPDAWKTHPLQNSTDFLVIATQPAMHRDDDDDVRDVLMHGDPPRTTEGVMMDRASSPVGFKEGRASSLPTRPSAVPPTSKIHQHLEDVQPDDEDDDDGTAPHVKLPLSAVDEPDIPTRHLENSVSTRTHGMRDAHINTKREPISDVHQRSSPHKDGDVALAPLLRRAQKRADVGAPSPPTQQHADDVAHVPSKKHMNGTQTSTRAPSVKDASTIVTHSVANAATQASTCATRTSSVNAAAQTNKHKPSSDLAPRKPPKKLNTSAFVAPQKPTPRVIRRSSTNNNNNVKNIQTVAPIINNNNIKPTKKKKVRRVGPPTQPLPPLPRPRATQRRNIRAWRRRRGAPRQLPWRRMNFSMDRRMTTDPPRKLSAQRRRSLMQSPSHMPRRSRRRATHVAHPPVPRRGRPLPRRTRRVFCHPRIYLRHRANIMGKRAAKLLKPFTRRRPARPQPRPAPPSSSRPPTMFSLGSSPQDLHIHNKDDGDVYGYLLTRHGFWGEAMRHIAVG